MEDGSNKFAVALRAHNGPKLRDAFEACRDEGAHNYDRTSLNRWLAGSVPTNGEAIRCLARQLEDPAIEQTWHEVRNEQPAKGQPNPATVTRRFALLNEKDQESAFQEIRRIYLGRFPSIRKRFRNRVEVLDPFPGEDDHLLVSVELAWIGRIPAEASLKLAPTYEDLGDAYTDPACIYRDNVDFEPDRLRELLDQCKTPTLSYFPTDSDDPRLTEFSGRWDSLAATFDNPPEDNVEIQVNLQYPIPRWEQQYSIRFGQYRIVDGATIVLALNSNLVTRPQAIPFLPPGWERAFLTLRQGPNALEVRLGTRESSVLSQGDGVVLAWGYNNPA